MLPANNYTTGRYILATVKRPHSKRHHRTGPKEDIQKTHRREIPLLQPARQPIGNLVDRSSRKSDGLGHGGPTSGQKVSVQFSHPSLLC